jgi:hypothetical protein
MNFKQEISYNKTKDKIYKLPCKRCDEKTNHIVLSSVQDDWSEMVNQDFDISGCDKYETVRCRGCDEISFRLSSSNSENLNYNEETGEVDYVEDENIYPSRIAGRKQIEGTHFLPNEIEKIYREIHAALSNDLSILTGVGIRVLAESICNERKTVGKNLEEKIDNLAEIGVLTKDGADILHSTRLLGNKAAHEIISLPPNIISTAMDVVEHLLIGTYILPKKAEKLPKRKMIVDS